MQRGSNKSNFIKYQNSMASESIERQRIVNLGLSNSNGEDCLGLDGDDGLGQSQKKTFSKEQKKNRLATVTDRSFSIQP